MARITKTMFRGQIPPSLDRSVRMVAAIQSKELGEVLTEALEYWLKSPDVEALIKRHNLDLTD